jgi:hypothetical protein
MFEIAFSTPSLPRCYNQDDFEQSYSESEKKRLYGWCEIAANLLVSQIKQWRQSWSIN